LSFRTNITSSTLLNSVRERAAELTAQTLSLRGRAATAVAGGAALGVLTVGSVAGALASADPEETAAPAVAVQAVGAGKAGQAVGLSPEKVAQKSTKKAAAAHDVLRVAEGQIGIREDEDGQTKFQEWYVDSPAAKLTAARDGGSVEAYNGANWCDMFVSWVADKAGAKGVGADAWTVQHAKWFKKNGRWGQEAKPGAVVFFDYSGEGISDIKHVGFVEKKNSDGTVSTIEGNADNMVKKNVRTPSEIAGYGYPDYVK
jgi:hypothetical protein